MCVCVCVCARARKREIIFKRKFISLHTFKWFQELLFNTNNSI